MHLQTLLTLSITFFLGTAPSLGAPTLLPSDPPHPHLLKRSPIKIGGVRSHTEERVVNLPDGGQEVTFRDEDGELGTLTRAPGVVAELEEAGTEAGDVERIITEM